MEIESAYLRIRLREGDRMFNTMIEKLKANPPKLVFTEGSDPRILEAAMRKKYIKWQS